MKRLFYWIKDWWIRKIEKKNLTTEGSPIFMEDIFNYLYKSDDNLKEIFSNRTKIIDYLVDRDKAFLSYLCNIIENHFDGEIIINIDDHEKYVWSLGEKVVDDKTRKLYIKNKVEIPNED